MPLNTTPSPINSWGESLSPIDSYLQYSNTPPHELHRYLDFKSLSGLSWDDILHQYDKLFFLDLQDFYITKCFDVLIEMLASQHQISSPPVISISSVFTVSQNLPTCSKCALPELPQLFALSSLLHVFNTSSLKRYREVET